MSGGCPRGDDTEFGDLPLKTLLKPDEIALFLSVSLKTIHRWYHSGKDDGASERIQVLAMMTYSTTAFSSTTGRGVPRPVFTRSSRNTQPE
jgi:hypothetical protein